MSIIDKLHNWFFTGSNDAWVDFNAGRDDGRAVFNAGRSLFILDTTGGFIPKIIDTDIDFGVVPYPKLDETQENYYVGCGDGLFSVPVTTADPERTGVIIEAMAYEGYDKIIPAYIESTLKARYAADEECSKMLGFIFEKQALSWSYLFANAVPDGMQFRIIWDTVPTNNFASWYAKNEEKELALMEKISESYQ